MPSVSRTMAAGRRAAEVVQHACGRRRPGGCSRRRAGSSLSSLDDAGRLRLADGLHPGEQIDAELVLAGDFREQSPSSLGQQRLGQVPAAELAVADARRCGRALAAPCASGLRNGRRWSCSASRRPARPRRASRSARSESAELGDHQHGQHDQRQPHRPPASRGSGRWRGGFPASKWPPRRPPPPRASKQRDPGRPGPLVLQPPAPYPRPGPALMPSHRSNQTGRVPLMCRDVRIARPKRFPTKQQDPKTRSSSSTCTRQPPGANDGAGDLGVGRAATWFDRANGMPGQTLLCSSSASDGGQVAFPRIDVDGEALAARTRRAERAPCRRRFATCRRSSRRRSRPRRASATGRLWPSGAFAAASGTSQPPAAGAEPPSGIAHLEVALLDLSAGAPGQDLLHQGHIAGPQGQVGPGEVGRGGHQHDAAPCGSAARRSSGSPRPAASDHSRRRVLGNLQLVMLRDRRGQQAGLRRCPRNARTIGCR